MKYPLILLLIFLPVVYGEEVIISIADENYHQYETLQAEVFINLSLSEKITAANFGLKDKNNATIPVSVFLEEISKDHYFVYFNLPKLENGAYYFLAKDIKYADGILKKISLQKEFYLDNISSISVYPAIVRNLNFTILKIYNYGEIINLSINADEINLSMEIKLKNAFNLNLNIPKNINDFDIKLDYLNKIYLIPVIPYREKLETAENFSKITKPLIQNPKNAVVLLNSTYGKYFDAKIELKKDAVARGPFYLKNTGNFPINNIIFNLTGSLNEIAKLNITHIVKINPNETIMQYIWVNEKLNPEKLYYSGDIEIKSSEGIIIGILPLEIAILEKNIIKKDNVEKIKEFVNKTRQIKIRSEDNNNENKTLIISSIIIIVVILLILIYFIFKKPNKNNF